MWWTYIFWWVSCADNYTLKAFSPRITCTVLKALWHIMTSHPLLSHPQTEVINAHHASLIMSSIVSASSFSTLSTDSSDLMDQQATTLYHWTPSLILTVNILVGWHPIVHAQTYRKSNPRIQIARPLTFTWESVNSRSEPFFSATQPFLFLLLFLSLLCYHLTS